MAIVPVSRVTLDEQTVLDGQALVLTNLNAGQVQSGGDEKKPAQCLCGGTGRSGDGLGPCSCLPTCECHKVKAEIQQVPLKPEFDVKPEDIPTDAEQDSVAVHSDELPREAVKTEFETDPFLEVRDDLSDTLDKVSKVAEKLSANQVEITNRLMDHESRLKSLEEATKSSVKPVQSTGFNIEQAVKETKKIRVKAIVVSQEHCAPCERMNSIFPSLESSGWKIGDGNECQIQRVKMTDLVSTTEAADAISKTRGTPCTFFYRDGVLLKSVAGEMTAKEFADTFNEIATGKPNAVKQGQTINLPRQRMPVVRTQWGVIDLETYSRNCDCPMCNGIRALQSGYLQTVMSVGASNVAGVVAAQQPTPSPIVESVMDVLNLSESDVFADIGCGDGRLLIEAATKFGCKAVGVEIDAVKAKEAREKVAAAGLSNRVTVLTGDAKSFDPKSYGVTAAVAYLYPETLGQLKPMLESVPVLVTPFHQVPGLVMEERGDLWVRDARNQPPLVK